MLLLTDSETLHGFALLAAMVAIFLLLLMIPIVLFNQPKFLVLPIHRRQPGAIAEWRGAEVPPTPPPGTGLHDDRDPLRVAAEAVDELNRRDSASAR